MHETDSQKCIKEGFGLHYLHPATDLYYPRNIFTSLKLYLHI